PPSPRWVPAWRKPVVSGTDLMSEGQGQPGFDGDVVGQVGVIELVVPEVERRAGGGQEFVGLDLVPGTA
ncbi:hypothetical protein AB0I34_44090, partial [Kribbella sp. NPDC050281]|uniref:hypothetical protein n=1 Tax=Kribbella sp. NPDC050281 TaxID=3155515 RepID=UPI0033D344DB